MTSPEFHQLPPPPPPPPPAALVEHAYSAPPPAPPPERPVATAAFVCGVIGSVIGLVPLFGLFAIPLGVIAVVMGIIGWRSVPRKRLARAATVLGFVAIGLGIAGFVIVDRAINELDEDIDEIEQEYEVDNG